MAEIEQTNSQIRREALTPDLSSSLSTLPTLKRIDRLRLDIGINFGIRGTSSHCALEPFTEINARTRGVSTEFPVYDVAAKYELSSREWVRRLHATIYAAAERAVSHCDHMIWNGTEHPEDKMPTLMVFSGPRPDLIGQKAPSPVEAFLSDYQLMSECSSTPFRERSGRISYQESSLHGRLVETFNEGRLSCVGLDGKWQVITPKLIQMKMAPEEHFAICATLDKTLAWSGLTLFELARVSREEGREEECWQIAIKSSNHRSWVHTAETTAPMPAEYLYSQEVGHYFTNRLMKEGLSLLKEARSSLETTSKKNE